MFKIKVIGAGQLGSRHLQALKSVKYPLEIKVVDPSESSLRIAKERYEAIQSGLNHKVSFCVDLDSDAGTDVAIIATNSDVRRLAIERLIEVSKPRLLVLEKLLFNNKNDYEYIESRLSDVGAKAWVNCPMRVMPTYEKIRKELSQKRITYRVTGGQFGLVTNAIHYIDHVAHLTGCEYFEIDTSGLDEKPIASKRKGFLELTGTLRAHFSNGSICEMNCDSSGSAPVIVEIFTESERYIVRESEAKLWSSGINSNWVWSEHSAAIPFQSQITTDVVESLLASNNCHLTPYASSAAIHLLLLDPLLNFMRSQSINLDEYPFT
jgi:predicted dehydrogenase